MPNDDPITINNARRRARFRDVAKAVDREAIIELGRKLYKLGGGKSPKLANISIGSPMWGSYHILYPLLVENNTRWLIKIPHNGVKGRWDEISAASLVSEAKTMSYLSYLRASGDASKPLIPQVLAYSDTTDNSIGCPYIALSYIEGVPLFKVWFQHRLEPNRVSADLIKKRRERTLRGLAEALAELGRYKFDEGGSLLFEDSKAVDGHTFLNEKSGVKLLKVGPARLPDEEAILSLAVEKNENDDPAPPSTPQVVVKQVNDDGQSPEHVTSSAQREHRSFRVFSAVLNAVKLVMGYSGIRSNQSTHSAPSASFSAKSTAISIAGQIDDIGLDDDDNESITELVYFTWGPSQTPSKYVTAPLDLHPAEHPFQKGVHSLLRKLIEWIPDPFYASPTDRFVLRHPDLNMQNIIVDNDGNLAGIVDWDGTSAVPRCLGNECYPSFLTSDWNPEVYGYESDMEDDDYVLDLDAHKPLEDSPETLRELRNTYLSIAMELQQGRKAEKQEELFSQHLESVCRASVVTENIATAAYDPLCRAQILSKVVAQSWLALKASGGPDHTKLSSFKVIQMFAKGNPDEEIIEKLREGFLRLLETVDK